MPQVINTLCFLFLFTTLISAQNQVPEISNLEVDINGNIMTVNYDLSDLENDDLEITFQVSDDEGQTYNLDTQNATGDVGFPINTGTGKSIVWNFTGVIDLNGAYKVKLIADDRQVIDIQEIVNQVDSNRLRTDLEMIEGIRHRIADPTHLQEVKDLLSNHFTNEGLETEIIQFDHNGYTAENIIGWKRGQVTETDTYIIDGHFDSVNDSPGADDNGSAIAGVMEALRVLAPYQFKKSIKFIGFDLEESGLLGSLHHVNTEGIKPNENIAGVFNFEMIGYYTDEPNSQTLPSGFEILYPEVQADLIADQFRGNFITNVGIESYPDLATAYEDAATTYVPDLKVVTILAPSGWAVFTPDLGRSDHAAFWLGELPALMLTDGSEFRYPYYHSPNDTLGNLDFTFMSNVVKAAVAAVAELAELSHSSSVTLDIAVTTNTHFLRNCNVEISPNPVRENIIISSDQCNLEATQIDLFNIKGQRVYSGKLINQVNEIPVTQLPAGTYLVKIQEGQSSLQKKIIVLK